ncbi:hypothetical protein PIB30_063491 [Stylosanthes scabra]|uniref:Uncharacterized protein n=1 Tax=Stylosanthes scabra TaxID=79078 RepID=A0ABU6ZK69_9FABA|nr:hypothetical protein [Stylosanthes scabra]
MAAKETVTISRSNNNNKKQQEEEVCNRSTACNDNNKSFGKKCRHLMKEQRAKFYILRRCVALLLCWDDHGISFISRALQARNEYLMYLESAKPEIRHKFKFPLYLGSAESEIRISGLQNPR